MKWKVNLIILIVLSIPGFANASKLKSFLTVESHYFTEDPILPEQEEDNYQNYTFKVAYDTAISDIKINTEATIYNYDLKDNYYDAVAVLTKYIDDTAISIGAKREDWRKGNWYAYDILNTSNTFFSMLEPEESLSQPMITLKTDIKGYVLNAYALVGHREQPFPNDSSRNRLPGEVNTIKEENGLGDGAIAFKVQHSTDRFDFSVHAFYGLSRQPAIVLVPNQTTIPNFNATYQEMFQVGGEFETNVDNYRLWTQLFFRQDFRNILGDVQDYFASNVGIEWQWFNVGEQADILLNIEYNYDSRDRLSNALFSKSIALSSILTTTSSKSWGFVASFLYDLNYENKLYVAKLNKILSETPYSSLFVKAKELTESNSPNFQDYFTKDTQLTFGLELEF